MDSHYLALMPAYASVTGLWFLIYKIIGQLYVKGMLIPNNDNNYVDALNQMY